MLTEVAESVRSETLMVSPNRTMLPPTWVRICDRNSAMKRGFVSTARVTAGDCSWSVMTVSSI